MNIQLIRNATIVVEYAGKKILVDPMFSKKGELASAPIPAKDWNMKKNPLHELPVSVEEIIKDIDFVFLSHLHFDHWDKAAEKALPKGIKIFVQDENDQQKIKKSGFTDVEILAEHSKYGDIKLSRTKAQHGKGFILRIAGHVSGLVLQHPTEKTLYIAADTIWYKEVEKTISKYNPEVIVVNGGDNRFIIGNQLVMNKADIYSVHKASPDAKIVVVHMEGVNHYTLSKKELRVFLNEKSISNNVLVPEDGEKIKFNGK